MPLSARRMAMKAVSFGQFHRYHTGGGQTNQTQKPPARANNKKPRRTTLVHRDVFSGFGFSISLTDSSCLDYKHYGIRLTVTERSVFTGIGAGAIATLSSWLLVADEFPPR